MGQRGFRKSEVFKRTSDVGIHALKKKEDFAEGWNEVANDRPLKEKSLGKARLGKKDVPVR